jgi:hypothetical protein
MASTSMDGQEAIVFCIVDHQTGVCGFTWYIEAHRTSFYIKSTFKPLQLTKISIHGPDPNHIGKQHFRLDFTKPDEAQKAINAGGGWAQFGQQLPLVFTGRRVNKRTLHLARFSADSTMFRPGMQRGPDPASKAKATLHAYVPAPSDGSVTHVDLYLSRVRPFWENREMKLRAADAGMGPLVSDAGMYLTAVISRRLATTEPDPFGDTTRGLPDNELIRGVGDAVDTTGLLWISEKMIPKADLAAVSPPLRTGPLIVPEG